jgi:hypothetical protein
LQGTPSLAVGFLHMEWQEDLALVRTAIAALPE